MVSGARPTPAMGRMPKKETQELSPSSSEEDLKKDADSISDKEEKSKSKRPWTHRLDPLRMKEVPPVPEFDAGLVPERSSSWFSRLTWGWMSSLMMKGYQRPLMKEDLWHWDDDRLTRTVADKLTVNLAKRKNSKAKHKLLLALNETFFWTFWSSGLLTLFGNVVSATSPLILKRLILFSEDAFIANKTGRPGPSVSYGVILAASLTAMQITGSLCQHHFLYRCMMVGALSRSALTSVIYRKSLTLSNKARLEYTNGKITNLMSTDVGRVDFAAGYFHMGWVAIIQVFVCLAILLINLGPSAMAGFGVLIISTPVLGRVMRILHKKRRKSTKFTDARVRLIQEILSTMRAIKFYTWEKSFLAKVNDIRISELKIVRRLLMLRNGVNAVSMSIPLYASILAFVTYSLTGNALRAANVFSSLTLFNMLRMPLMFLPRVISACIDAWVALDRVEALLLADELEKPIVDYRSKFPVVMKSAKFIWEVDENAEQIEKEKKKKGKKWLRWKKKQSQSDKAEISSNNSDKGSAKDGKTAHVESISFKFGQLKKLERTSESSSSDASTKQKFSYDSDSIPISIEKAESNTFQTGGLSFHVEKGEFVVVVGEIGSGKSSLLAALVGEMRRTNGFVKLGGTVGYCPQVAWIRNATLKKNILFGKEFDQEKYDRVITGCALEPDLEMLPNGDETEIGERGVTLSGGQKARVNIARAAYNDADIYFLDDPLSAVDAHVGRHLLEECICGLMAGKTRILVTHQLHVLPHADRIFCMHDGRIVEQGTYEELLSRRGNFARLIELFGNKDEEKKADEPSEPAVPVKKGRNGGRRGRGLMEPEERKTGAVARAVYLEYARAAGGLWVIPLVLLSVITCNAVNLTTALWLSSWTSNKYKLPQKVYIGVYAGLGFSQAIFIFVFGVLLTISGNRATKKFHQRAIERIIRAPMSFFDTTPLGRIINRFSKDVDTMDNKVSDSYRMLLMTFTMICGTFVLVIVYFPLFTAALVPLFFLFFLAALFYRTTAREVKRLDAILRSHVYANFGETLTGLSTIRAYGKQVEFAEINDQALDVNNRAYFLTIINQRWLGVRLDFVGFILIFVVSILVVTSRFSVNPAIGGLVLSYCIQVVGTMGQMTRQFAEVENNMNSTERVFHYATAIESEAPYELPDRKPPNSWPDRGEIVMNDVMLRYRQGLPVVLKGLSLNIRGGERIGIVGRTGAGKSSILVALFRLVELCGGSITIDGIDISQLGLHDLRSSIAIIPQDPVLFQGTIRSNLDPLNEIDDVALWRALHRVHLVDENFGPGAEKGSSRFHLEEVVGDDGANFSLGQRQLLAMARALVRNARIIIMDEATSSVDFETDAKIQNTIKQEFKGATLLTIAHRLRTIINYDRIVVMDDGVAVEFDTPLNLYDNPDGVFHFLCEKGGIQREDIVEATDYEV